VNILGVKHGGLGKHIYDSTTAEVNFLLKVSPDQEIQEPITINEAVGKLYRCGHLRHRRVLRQGVDPDLLPASYGSSILGHKKNDHWHDDFRLSIHCRLCHCRLYCL